MMRIAAFGLLAGCLITGLARAGKPFDELDREVEEAIARRELPGAVVVVLHRNVVVHRKAYGRRRVQPTPEPMTLDTVFDLASLTKPLATATSVLLLMDQGKLRPSDPASRHWPAFRGHGKETITLEQLLLHTSGLTADNALADYADGRTRALERIAALPLLAEPGARFTYSDVGYIVLGEVVERVSGVPLERFATEHVFGPLGMRETTFLPGDSLKARAAPTELREGKFATGEVHDPRAHRMGGVAGHAGLFGTADDLVQFARMLLSGGERDGRRILSTETVRTMTAARRVPGGLRAYGWDVDTSYSKNRGEVFARGTSYGHTGFTGTSLWVDPELRAAVVFLSNRVHPDGKGNVTRLRGRVATLAGLGL